MTMGCPECTQALLVRPTRFTTFTLTSCEPIGVFVLCDAGHSIRPKHTFSPQRYVFQTTMRPISLWKFALVNPLTGEHILVSPHRMKRPWQGQVEPPQAVQLPQYDPTCYLCPGNQRVGGEKNDLYKETMTFVNDFAAVLPPPGPEPPKPQHPLLTAEPVEGACDVLIFHPRHDLTLARLPIDSIEKVIDQWCKLYTSRGTQEGIKYVQIFEVSILSLSRTSGLIPFVSPKNKGAMMGCSNPHPHGQVWSLSIIPTLPATELKNLREYSLATCPSEQSPTGPKGRACLLCDYARYEVSVDSDKGRVVSKNDHWVALVPWWAVWPFEVLGECQAPESLMIMLMIFQYSRISDIYPPSCTWTTMSAWPLPKSSRVSRSGTITSFRAPSRILWGFTNAPYLLDPFKMELQT